MRFESASVFIVMAADSKYDGKVIFPPVQLEYIVARTLEMLSLNSSNYLKKGRNEKA